MKAIKPSFKTWFTVGPHLSIKGKRLIGPKHSLQLLKDNDSEIIYSLFMEGYATPDKDTSSLA